MATENLLTPEFRLGFPALATPQSVGGGEPKFSITMLFPKDADISALKLLAKAAATEKWGENLPADLQLPWGDGDTKEWEGFPGNTFIRCASQYQPGMVDANLQEIINPVKDLYGGCYCRAQVNAYAWTYMAKNGVSFGLQNVQKLKDGDSFSGRQNASDVFGTVPGGATASGGDTTAGTAAAAGQPANDVFG